MNIDDLLKDARKTWGQDKIELDKILIRLGVVVGDLHRIARTHQETGVLDEAETKKEMGNIIYSMIRWCDNLGYDPKECISLAKQAQAAYAKRLHESGKTSAVGS